MAERALAPPPSTHTHLRSCMDILPEHSRMTPMMRGWGIAERMPSAFCAHREGRRGGGGAQGFGQRACCQARRTTHNLAARHTHTHPRSPAPAP